MKKIRDVIIKGNMLLGSVMTITAILDIELESAATVKITIEDPTETVKVTNVNMTELNDHVYQYLYQSASTDDDGIYLSTITVTTGGKTIVRQDVFEILEQE